MAQSIAEANRLMEQQRLGGFDYPNDEFISNFANGDDDFDNEDYYGDYYEDCHAADDDEDDDESDHSNGVGV